MEGSRFRIWDFGFQIFRQGNVGRTAVRPEHSWLLTPVSFLSVSRAN